MGLNVGSLRNHLFTSGYDLVGMVVLGGWLDFMILEVFSNL